MPLVVSSKVLRRGIRAFSLIEIVLAISIISFALVGILGLFPVALDSATSSQRETQAAIIARSILSDVAAQTGKTRYLVYGTNSFSSASPDEGGEDSRPKIAVDLTTADSNYFSYVVSPTGDGFTQDKSSGDAYTGGNPNAAYLAEVSTTTAGLPVGLTQISVTVSAPAAAPLKNRTTYPFVTLVGNGLLPP